MSRSDFETLQAAMVARAEVEIVLTDCLYACCHRGWEERLGYEQTYRGVVARLTIGGGTATVLLHAIAVGTLNYSVLAELRTVLDVSLVD